MKILVTRKKNSFFSFFFFHPDYKYTPTSLLKLSVYLSVQISKKEGKTEGGRDNLKSLLIILNSSHPRVIPTILTIEIPTISKSRSNSSSLLSLSPPSLFPYVSFNFQEKRQTSILRFPLFLHSRNSQDNEDKRGHFKGRVGSKLRPKEPIATLYAIPS